MTVYTFINKAFLCRFTDCASNKTVHRRFLIHRPPSKYRNDDVGRPSCKVVFICRQIPPSATSTMKTTSSSSPPWEPRTSSTEFWLHASTNTTVVFFQVLHFSKSNMVGCVTFYCRKVNKYYHFMWNSGTFYYSDYHWSYFGVLRIKLRQRLYCTHIFQNPPLRLYLTTVYHCEANPHQR